MSARLTLNDLSAAPVGSKLKHPHGGVARKEPDGWRIASLEYPVSSLARFLRFWDVAELTTPTHTKEQDR